MNIRDLEYFVTLAEYRHFRHAAEACNVSQPTLSGQIRKLENELGVMLLERTSRKVLFTQTGLLLVEQARKILRDVKIFKEMANKQSGEMSGPLYVGLIPTVAPYFLPHVIPMLSQTFPELEMYLQEGQTHHILTLLEQGKLDCAILAAVREAENFITIPLFDEPMRLAVSSSHQWAGRDSIKLDELKGEKLLMLEDGHCLREHAMGYCFQSGIQEDTRYIATSLETLRSMIASGSGMTLFPELATPKEHDRDGVSYIRCTDPEPVRSIVLVYRPGSPLKARYEQLAKSIKQYVPQILSAKHDAK